MNKSPAAPKSTVLIPSPYQPSTNTVYWLDIARRMLTGDEQVQELFDKAINHAKVKDKELYITLLLAWLTETEYYWDNKYNALKKEYNEYMIKVEAYMANKKEGV